MLCTLNSIQSHYLSTFITCSALTSTIWIYLLNVITVQVLAIKVVVSIYIHIEITSIEDIGML